MNPELFKPLVDLDNWLKKQGSSLNLEIIGGFALELHKVNISRATTDIDNVSKISDRAIIDKINEIGRLHGIDGWIDCPDISLPKNYKTTNVKMFENFHQISAKILSKRDIIIMKVASYYDRMHLTGRDLEDVGKIIESGEKFDKSLLNEALAFTKETRKVTTGEQLERLNDVKKDFMKLLG